MSKTQNPAAPRRHYDNQFKADAVQLLENGQRSVPDVAKSLGVSANMLYRWRDLAQVGKGQGANQPELTQLREQLRRTEQERDILKKAPAIFSPGGEPRIT